ncbi:hypothetical protein FAES_1401 [Fibrella aestuarina BUZ 2]|uniref:Lipoprotein n=1 Tax=Fibrella aestuarina BUZ 2 TaxID=1166018 RepID=I0K5K8_9BACT|nr:hypothetical protein [Fibrella aestuarina]CCG99411.1 hypothetical protein FAES_1401 [Fibrella aestuarina BUZ 2]
MKRFLLTTLAALVLLASCKDPITEPSATPAPAARPTSANARCLASSIGVTTPNYSSTGKIAVDPTKLAYYLAFEASGTVTINGHTYTYPGQAVYLVKYNASNAVEWVSSIGGANAASGAYEPQVEVDYIGRVFVALHFVGTIAVDNTTVLTPTSGDTDGLVARYMAAGGTPQLRRFNGSGNCSALRLAHNPANGDLYVSSRIQDGITNFGPGTTPYNAPSRSDIALVKLPANSITAQLQVLGTPSAYEQIDDLFFDQQLYFSGQYTGSNSSFWGMSTTLIPSRYTYFAGQLTLGTTGKIRMVLSSLYGSKPLSVAAHNNLCYVGGEFYGDGTTDFMLNSPNFQTVSTDGFVLRMDLTGGPSQWADYMTIVAGPAISSDAIYDITIKSGVLLAAGRKKDAYYHAYVLRKDLTNPNTPADETLFGVDPGPWPYDPVVATAGFRSIQQIRAIAGNSTNGPLLYALGNTSGNSPIYLCNQTLPANGAFIIHE